MRLSETRRPPLDFRCAGPTALRQSKALRTPIRQRIAVAVAVRRRGPSEALTARQPLGRIEDDDNRHSINVCMYVCIYVCKYVCMHVCMYVSMYVCMYVCLYACMVCTSSPPRLTVRSRVCLHLPAKLPSSSLSRPAATLRRANSAACRTFSSLKDLTSRSRASNCTVAVQRDRDVAQHSTTPHSTAQHTTHSTAPQSTTPHSTTPHSTAQHRTAQHNTAQHSTAPHSTTPHSIAQHSGRKQEGYTHAFAAHHSSHQRARRRVPHLLQKLALTSFRFGQRFVESAHHELGVLRLRSHLLHTQPRVSDTTGNPLRSTNNTVLACTVCDSAW